MATSQPTLVELAAKVTELSETFTKYLKENNVPTPTFAADSPTSYKDLGPEVFTLRQTLIDTLQDMWILTQGPSESVFNYVHSAIPDAAALNILNHFDFWAAVPLDGSASYPEIAKHVNLPLEVVQRVIQHAVTLRLFVETEPGRLASRIQHTCRSAALARSKGLQALVATTLDDSGAPMMVMHEALARFSAGKSTLTQDMNESSFALFHKGGTFGTHGNTWDRTENDGDGDKKGWRSANYVEFMRYVKELFQLEAVVLEAADWSSVGKATVVDVGGSAGHDAIVLAKNFPELTITVQDLPQVQPVFEANLPADLKSRVSFTPHNFFEPQPVSADIYIFKMILHDWPDEEAAKIIRGLIPALKTGARIIFFEYIGNHGETEGPPLPRSIQNMGTATDLRLMALFNGKERPIDAWGKIIRSADERFEVVSTTPKPEKMFVVVEAVWRG
ncbi:sterigmatocystin 8-O-methyltransferase [Melanomma pulvis-pyrius CBS 109.77]|uniref:Sterigmatocystin 8-O-methyltransferase n=1 Tax=Melanomma pulvis-pyrius CBS 109.77 TaxID=1314802 RepID=A0A6A6XG05_9PLEO|nr:sterigmatocystin 8-O-methyltransferase [Melanomma pulvis-pyrius CBS 109.77]